VDQPDPRATGRIGREPISKTPRCAFCESELSAVQEFVYHVESFNFLDDPLALEILRRLPTSHGEPLRLCRVCRDSIETNVREKEAEGAADARSGVLAWRLMFWLLVLPLGLLLSVSAVTEVVNWFR
jgi:hypothetical protein